LELWNLSSGTAGTFTGGKVMKLKFVDSLLKAEKPMIDEKKLVKFLNKKKRRVKK
jgi:hypothetical protein